ncbi:hypothetical protein XBJ2_760002 [Xenorhabdus bovienii str. Jollieti]|uniref:Uncharacterized protein n=1 Tax=Xenorhabdus bovienii (strain SS-2004) TaxID=406818 RepID=D3V095_XENBS|nr:hypothetical protein XBJ1_1520 [Xenorhabdus bovienii SS-2004]CDH30355.1 hypothetical protein XBJ2_760002 [Xenorhabdus bovienii str. Jollieti]
MIPPRSALKKDKLASEYHRRKIDELGDPLLVLDKYVDFSALADTRRPCRATDYFSQRRTPAIPD